MDNTHNVNTYSLGTDMIHVEGNHGTNCLQVIGCARSRLKELKAVDKKVQ